MFPVEEKLNPEAEPKPVVPAGVLEVPAAKEKEEEETAEEAAEEEPNPEGGCVGAAKVLPKPAVDDGVAEEPNPLLGEAKLKVLAWAGAGAPKPAWSEGNRMNTGVFTGLPDHHSDGPSQKPHFIYIYTGNTVCPELPAPCFQLTCPLTDSI